MNKTFISSDESLNNVKCQRAWATESFCYSSVSLHVHNDFSFPLLTRVTCLGKRTWGEHCNPLLASGCPIPDYSVCSILTRVLGSYSRQHCADVQALPWFPSRKQRLYIWKLSSMFGSDEELFLCSIGLRVTESYFIIPPDIFLISKDSSLLGGHIL